MRVRGKKPLALATVAAILATSVVSTFSALAAAEDDLTAAGYSKADGLNVHLADDEYYKELSGFEKLSTDWAMHASFAHGSVSAAGASKANSGNDAAKVVLKKGEDNKILVVQNMFSPNADTTDAKYVQFYVENASENNVEFSMLKFDNSGLKGLKADAKDAKFYDYETNAWETPEFGGTIMIEGKRQPAGIVIPGGKKGIVRIPLNNWEAEITSIARFQFWINAPLSQGADTTLYLDDLGLVAEADASVTPPDKGMLNILKQNAEKFLEREDEYTADSWKLYMAEYNRIIAMPENTQAEVKAKESALLELAIAEEELLEKKPVEQGENPTEVPDGYTQTPGEHIHLADDEFYKELSGAETFKTDWNTHAFTKGTAEQNTDKAHINGGNGSAKYTFKTYQGVAGSMNHLNVIDIKPSPAADCSKAKYLQFYAENTSDQDLEFSQLCLNGSGTQNAQLSTATVQFYDLNAASPSWKEGEVRKSLSSYSGLACEAAIIIPAHSKGLYRIPLMSWEDVTSISRIFVYMAPTTTSPNAVLYLDDFGLVGVLGAAPILNMAELKAAKEAAAKKAEKDYTAESWEAFTTALTTANAMPETTQDEVDAKADAINEAINLLVKKPIEEEQVSKYTDKPSQNVYLNPGEKYKYLAGGEDSDINPIDLEHAFARGQITLVEDIKNSGAKGIQIMQTSGDSQNAFHALFSKICAEQKDWSDAKYLTFWVENDQANAKAVLELFYIQARTAAGDDLDLIDYNMEGIKFFDQRTGKWSDLEVMPNKQHRLPGDANPDGTYNMVPTLQIPANAKGLVRIPLTNVDTEDLKTVERFQIFLATSGATGLYYVDDIGLVTYDGDTAPDYVNGKGDGTTPGGDNDTPGGDEEGGDEPSFEWGDENENGDGDEENGSDVPQTGVNSMLVLAALLLVSGSGACLFFRRRSRR